MQKTKSNLDYIVIRGACEHNLKKISINVPRNKLVVFSGVSGSGKSSLAFDTIYAEGRRRYMESLSSYARQFMENHGKPKVEFIGGISPAIAIDQKISSKNPRSTVATATEIYDYLRILVARIGIPHSPQTGKPIQKQSIDDIMLKILALPHDTTVNLFSSVVKNTRGDFRRELHQLRKNNIKKVKIDGKIYPADELPILDRQKKHSIDLLTSSIKVADENKEEIQLQIINAIKKGNGIINLEIIELPKKNTDKSLKVGDVISFSERFACPTSGFEIGEIEPRLFSFNNAYGACQECNGTGKEDFFDPNLIVENPELSLKEGAIPFWCTEIKNNQHISLKEHRFHLQMLESLAKHYNFNIETAFQRLPQEIKNIIFYGSNQEEIKFTYDDGFRKKTITQSFEGLISYLKEQEKKQLSSTTKSVSYLGRFKSIRNCSSCNGHRLRKEALCIRIGNKNIGEISQMSVTELIQWLDGLKLILNSKEESISHQIIKEIIHRLKTIESIGLGYLSLNRRAHTLSGGESQRIKLATQIGSTLTGVLYVLDEPSIGLHQRDNDKLLQMLKSLRDLGNSVIVVEHDEDTIKAADYIIDVGPGAGINGGTIIAEGTVDKILNDEQSITGQYLSKKLQISMIKDKKRINHKQKIIIEGAKSHNLQNINAEIPIGTFVAITGVSGSGKSTFTIHTLYKAIAQRLNGSKASAGEYKSIKGLEYIDKIIEVDQSPIGRTPRSNPATYISAFSSIRDWYANLPEAKEKGYNSGRFSFNVRGGRCEVCEGDGMIKVEMHFLSDVYIECEECKGKRYNKDTLSIKYKNKSIADILEMVTDHAVDFFQNVENIKEKLLALQEVGLGYMKIGQSATTLSGGEAQRIKLAKELSKKSTGNTLYVLDEPTTGLHSHDINQLLKVLHKLVDQGNTVIVIEHNLHVIKNADYIIDMGPEGGKNGGKVVVAGTPQEIALCKESITGKYLKHHL